MAYGRSSAGTNFIERTHKIVKYSFYGKRYTIKN